MIRLFASTLLLGIVLMVPSQATSLELDLADIVGGGDGTGTGGDQGIDPRDGSVETTHALQLPGITVNSYQPVATNPFIDGVVIPDGGPAMTNPIPISSTSLTVTGIPDGDGKSFDHIWNGLNLNQETTLPFNSVLGMNTNKGITFDLDAIESTNAAFEATLFSSGFAMGTDVPSGDFGNASMFVIVDGVIKASANLTTPNVEIPVSVVLNPSDRFLTLLTSSNGVLISDHTFYVDPSVTVPEPSTFILSILSLIGLGFSSRRRMGVVA